MKPGSWILLFLIAGITLGEDNLPGKGLAQHPFLDCGAAKPGSPPAIYVLREGKVEWTYPLSARDQLEDCTMLSSGTIVFARGSGASIVRQD